MISFVQPQWLRWQAVLYAVEVKFFYLQPQARNEKCNGLIFAEKLRGEMLRVWSALGFVAVE